MILFALIFGLVVWLSLQPQSWYAPPNFDEPKIAELADLAERRMNEEFHKVRSIDEVWHLRITEEAVNAWLSGRLEGWLTHDQYIEMPQEVQAPQIHITKEGIWLAANILTDIETKPQPLAIKLQIRIESGILFADPISVRLGRVPIPIAFFQSVITELQEDLRGVRAIAPLIDDREVHILEIELEENAFVLTCQTRFP